MKRFRTRITGFLVLLTSSVFLLGCNPQPKNVTDDIANANLQFMEAFNQGDASALAMNYTLNAKLFPSNSDVIEGREAIEGFWKAVMGMGITKAELETVYAEGYGNSALEEGRYKLFVEGGQMVDQGKYVVGWKKEDGQWKLDRDIWNTNNPALTPRAALNDTVWIIEYRIKADKTAQFENYNFNILEPAVNKTDPAARNSVRSLKAAEPNKDGTYSYYYIVDPILPGNDYYMEPFLTAQYGKEKADEYIKMFNDCRVKESWDKKVIQTSW